MNRFFLSILLIFGLLSTSTAQNATAFWGEEFKLKIRDADLHVVWVDNTGVYFIEEHLVLTSYFIIGSTSRESAGLVKLDKNLNEIYRKNFDKELKKKKYQDIVFSKKKMYLLSSDYDKDDKIIKLYALELNKVNAEQIGDWKEISTFALDKKNDDLKFKVSLNNDSTRFRIVSGMDGAKQTAFSVQEFDENFTPSFKKVDIISEFEPEKYDLEDIITAPNGNILFVSRIMDYEEGKKEKKKHLQFQNYNLRLYNPGGSMIKEVNTNVEGRRLMDSKCILLKTGDYGLAAFYSNSKKGKEINGLMMQQISSKDGSVLSYSNQEISASMLADNYDDNEEDEDETKEERAERKRLAKLSDDEDGVNQSFKIRGLATTDDGGLVLVSEKSYTYTVTRYNPTTRSSSTYIYYFSNELLISKFDASGKVAWLKLIPKLQREVVSSGMSIAPSNYFVSRFQFPHWGGVGLMQLPGKNTISLLINDNPKNATVTKAGQKAKAMINPKKSNAFILNVDLANGNVTRKFMFSNEDTPAAMIRHGVAFGNTFYMVGKKTATFGIMAKPKISIGRINFK